MHRALREILSASGGLVSRRQDPELANEIDLAKRHGQLIAVFPGIYAAAEIASHWQTRARAACLWDADAVIIGDAAAALSFRRGTRSRIVEVATRRRKLTRTGMRFVERTIPPELVLDVSGVRVSCPDLTAIDLAPHTGGNSIDDALRSRMSTLDGMYRALQMGRRGNAARRRYLLDSRGEPWSSGEREAHRALRASGVTGWRANVRIVCGGATYFQDIAFDDSPLVAEIDGVDHLRPERFAPDRVRGNDLLLAGKHVLHFTTGMVSDTDLFLGVIREALARYSAR